MTQGTALVADAAAMPEPPEVEPMPRARRRHVGAEIKRLDVPAKVDGSAIYGSWMPVESRRRHRDPVTGCASACRSAKRAVRLK